MKFCWYLQFMHEIAWVGCSWSDLTLELQFRQGAAAQWDAHCEHRCFPGRGTQSGGGACECRHTKTGDEASLQCQFIILNPSKSTHTFNFSHDRHPTPTYTQTMGSWATCQSGMQRDPKYLSVCVLTPIFPSSADVSTLPRYGALVRTACH
jgi:hypothetical protein